MSEIPSVINSNFWQEIEQPNDPFAADVVRCSGYDVYGELIRKASYFEYIYLLFKGERPSKEQGRALEILSIAIANPGPRDPAVHAAMCGGVGGSTSASILIAALSVGAGSYGGAREVFLMTQFWQQRTTNLTLWCELLNNPPALTKDEVWPACEHPPGFAPYDSQCRLPVIKTLDELAAVLPNGHISWLRENRLILEKSAKHPLSMAGLTATCLFDLGFSPSEAEILTLLLRLPGAAAHAIEQNNLGFRQFPYFNLDLMNDPGPDQAKESI